MDECSKLFPERIRAQCDAIINKLEEDNESLRQARVAMGAFICDDTNHTQGIRNLKRKMLDYQKVCDLFILANSADIADSRRLKGIVGEEDLIGHLILQQIRDRKADRIYFEERIDYYQSIRDGITFRQRINPFDRTASDARRSQRRYEENLSDVNEIITRYEAKVERYKAIELESKNFFTTGCDLRAEGMNGVGYIRGASSELPCSFASPELSGWRSAARVEKDYATEIIEQMLSDIISQFTTLDEDGNIVSIDWEGLESAGYNLIIDDLTSGLIKRFATVDEDGNVIAYNWEMMRILEENTVLAIIINQHGGESLNEILYRTGIAESFLQEWREDWGLTEEIVRLDLLLENLQNYRIMEAIQQFCEDPRFSLERWRNATVAERKDILQEYKDVLTGIFEVEVSSSIYFFYEHSENRGFYQHLDEEGTKIRQVGVNEWRLDDPIVELCHAYALNMIRHELRHAYQSSAVDNPENFMVSAATLEVWSVNLPHSGYYIRNGHERGDSSGIYTWHDYRNQPLEVDAFSLVYLREWQKIR